MGHRGYLYHQATHEKLMFIKFLGTEPTGRVGDESRLLTWQIYRAAQIDAVA